MIPSLIGQCPVIPFLHKLLGIPLFPLSCNLPTPCILCKEAAFHSSLYVNPPPLLSPPTCSHIYLSIYIYIYIFVEPFLSVQKLLLQRSCNRSETRDYYGLRHGPCHKGVDRRRVAAPKESAAQIPSLTENDAMFFVGLRTANMRFRIIVTIRRAKR